MCFLAKQIKHLTMFTHICGYILTCIYDYTFELGIRVRVFLHALIHMLLIHSDGVLLFACIVCNYGSFHALLPTIFD